MDFPDKLVVQQQIEPLEIFAGISAKNRYRVLSQTGRALLYAYEESNDAARIFLSAMRPLTIRVIDSQKLEVVRIERGWKWFVSHWKVTDGNQQIASIDQKFVFFNKKHDVTIDGKKFLSKVNMSNLWGFRLYDGKEAIASVDKKWNGIGKEIFTRADNFRIDFGRLKSDKMRKVLIAHAFAIDIDFFERK